jgi:hypothetical protein
MYDRLLPGTMRLKQRQTVAGSLSATAAFVLVIALLAGCQSTRARSDLLRMDGADGFYARGHAVSGRMIAGRLRYSMQSILAGKYPSQTCHRTESNAAEAGIVLRIESCAPVEGFAPTAASLMPTLLNTTAELRTYFPGLRATEVKFVLVPFGTRHRVAHRGWRKPGDLRLSLAFWWSNESDEALRAGIRSFAHEYTHLALKVEREKLASEEGEFLASVSENCIELAVFGNIDNEHVDVSDDIMAGRVASESLLKSVNGSRLANATMRARFQEEGESGVRLFCRETLQASGSSAAFGHARNNFAFGPDPQGGLESPNQAQD